MTNWANVDVLMHVTAESGGPGVQFMLTGSSLTHVEGNLGGFVAQGLARVHWVLGMSQVGHVRQACSIRADIDNDLLATPLQHWQQALCDCKCADNIDVQCLLQVINVPVNMGVSGHKLSITLQPALMHTEALGCSRYSLVLCTSITTQNSSIVDQVVNSL